MRGREVRGGEGEGERERDGYRMELTSCGVRSPVSSGLTSTAPFPS